MKKLIKLLTGRLFVVFAILGLQVLLFVMLLMNFTDSIPVLRNIFWVGAIILAIWLVSKDESPGYKLAWMLLLVIVPIVGILLYYFFAQRSLDKKTRERVTKVFQGTVTTAAKNEGAYRQLEEQAPELLRQSEFIQTATYMPAFQNTKTKYYKTGELFWQDLLQDLKNAQTYIFMEYFIVEEGLMWNSVLEILKEKAAQGVKVRFMYDDMGCVNLLPRDYAQTLRSYGIECMVFNRLRPALNSLFNNRDHRKITAIDGKVAYVGGANLADEYINHVQRFGNWKDACLRMEGEAAFGFTAVFLQIWLFRVNQPEDILQYRATEPAKPCGGFVQPYADNPLDHGRVGHGVYLNMINHARKYLYINTPYLILDNILEEALCMAAKSGVDVRITTPHIPDKKFVFLLTRAQYKKLLQAGVKIFEYEPGFIHSKTFVCDDRCATVGTVNLDYRSLFLHFECGAWMADCDAVMQIKEDFLQTQEVCVPITLEFLRARPWVEKVVQFFLHVFAPLF